MVINPLLFYMQASDYPDILENLDKIPCDKYIVKYSPYPHPHNLAREFFLSHPEYTHLIVMPQDLLVKPENYFKLVCMVEKEGYDVLSGVCNVDRPEHPNFWKWAVCMECPDRIRNQRHYNWMPKTEMKLGVLEMGFQGMILCCISRRVLHRTTAEGEPIFKGCIHTDGNPAPDLNFCLNCKNLGIPIHVDTDNRMFHYANHKPSLVNKKKAEAIFLRKGCSVLA